MNDSCLFQEINYAINFEEKLIPTWFNKPYYNLHAQQTFVNQVQRRIKKRLHARNKIRRKK